MTTADTVLQSAHGGDSAPSPLDRTLPVAAMWSVLGLGLLLAWPSALAAQQRGPVGGTVVAEGTLRPLSGAQVMVAGTEIGTLTDEQGRFRIEDVSGPEVTLRVRLIGYRTTERTVSVGETDVRVQLSESAIALEEIVVTGTPGATQRRAIGNAVGTINAAQRVEQGSPPDFQSLLGGRVPGVNVQFGSGNVGTGGVVRVRGLSSLSLDNEPIIYVDGVRINSDPRAGPSIRGGRQVSRLNDIPPENIERIEVIKGPAAATLYGTEASAGVIQIITKSGASGEARYRLEVQQGANWFRNAAERLPTNYWINPETGQLESDNPVRRMDREGNPIFTTGHSQGYNGSISGGFEGGPRYYLSGGYSDETGMLDYNWRKRFSGRLNVDYQISNNLNVGTNLQFIRNDSRLGMAASGWDIIAQIVWGSPRRLRTATNGFLRATPDAVGTIRSKAEIDRSIGGVNINHSISDWFSQRLNAGLDIGNEENSILFPRHPTGDDFFFGQLSLGDKNLERRRSAFFTVDYSATATLELTDDLRAETSTGVQYIEKRFHTATAQGRVFPIPGVASVGGAATTFGGEDFLENKTFGLFVQERFTWNQRIYLTLGVRGDDNSAFGQNFDFVTYPKASLAWVVSEEPFWNIDAVNSLRLRGAYGQSGKQPDVFAAVRLFQPTSGPGGTSTVTPSNIGNPDLEPERGEEVELGFEASLFEDRLGLDFTYFTKWTKDAILRRGVAPSSGFPGDQFVNLGEVRGNGFELSARGRVTDREKMTWDFDYSVSRNTNEVKDLGGLPPLQIEARQAHREGFPIASFFFRRVVEASVDENGSVAQMLCEGGSGGGGPVPCSEAPDVFNGVPYPTWTSSLSTTLRFLGDLELYGLLRYEDGHHLLNGDVGAAHVLLRNSREILKQGDKDPFLAAYDAMNMWRVAGFMDAGFLKLREISVAYSFPDRWTSKLGVDAARLRVGGRNLATLWQAQEEIYGRPVMDPEVRETAEELDGYVQTVLPPMTSFSATLSLNF